MKYHQCFTVVRLAMILAIAGALSVAQRAQAVTVGPGAFQYEYNTQNATGTGTPDPNAVTSANLIFSGDGGAPNNPPNYVNFYRFGTNANNPSVETYTYTFDAAAGEVFDGTADVTDRINVFNFLGNVRGEFSTDGGATFSDYTLRGTNDPEFATNSINVDGASSVILRYNLFSIAPVDQEDQVQFLRQANVNLQNLEQTPFVFSGQTRVIPEPASIALLGLGGLFGVGIIWRQRRG